MVAAAPWPAAAQAWSEYRYPDEGFVIQFPAAPQVTRASFTTRQGQAAPATIHRWSEGGLTLTAMVADFSESPLDRVALIAEGVAAAAGDGRVTIDMIAHIDLQFGRQVSVTGRKGERTSAVVFLLDRRLYVVTGRASGRDATKGSGNLVRFVDSLSFPNQPGGPIPDEVLRSLSGRN